MLNQIPGIQGIVFTFIETGARIERQHSKVLKSDQEKLATVVNAVADRTSGSITVRLRRFPSIAGAGCV